MLRKITAKAKTRLLKKKFMNMANNTLNNTAKMLLEELCSTYVREST
jgi:hypothetical protein